MENKELLQKVNKYIEEQMIKGKGLSVDAEELMNYFLTEKNNYSSNDLLDAYEYFIKKYDRSSGMFYTPRSIVQFISRIAKIKDNNLKEKEAAVLCSGYGSALTIFGKETKNIKGYELNHKAIEVSKAALEIASVQALVEQKNLLSEQVKKSKYDIVVMNPPWKLSANTDYVRKNSELLKDFDKNRMLTSDSAFVSVACDCLRENGVAYILTTPSFLYGENEKILRKILIEKGLLDELILLPEGILPNTFISPILMILSKKQNKSFRIIDSTQSVIRINRDCVIDETKALKEYKNSKNRKIVFTYKTVKNNDYNLNVFKYLNNKKVVIKDAQELKDVCEIIPGYQYTSKTVTEIENGSTKIAKISNIDLNKLDIDNLSSANIDLNNKQANKYLLQENDVLVSVKGNSYTCGIVENIGENKIVPQSNLVILRPNTEKIYPKYLLMDMLKNQTLEQINNSRVGTVIKSLPLKELEQLKISVPDVKTQRLVANRLDQIREKIKQLQQEEKALMSKYILFINEDGE